LKKIVIRPSPKEEELILLLAFIKEIQTKVENSKIYIVVEPEYRKIFQLIPISTDIHELSVKDSSIPDIHKWSYKNHDLFNIDTYFDFENNHKSTFLGWTLRSRQRVGSGNFLNKMMLTHHFQLPVGMGVKEKYLKALEIFSEKKEAAQLEEIPFKIDSNRKEAMESIGEEPYIVVRFSKAYQEFEDMKKIEDFLSHFGNIKIYALSFKGEKDLGEFNKKMAEKMKFEAFLVDSSKDLQTILSDSKGVLTDELWFGLLSQSYQIPSIYVGSDQAQAGIKKVGFQNIQDELDSIHQFFKI